MSINNEIVIQLGKFNETVKKNDTGLNSVWSNHCKQSVTINQGDQVMVSKSYIDTRNLSSANIVIQEDIELSLEMFYYWINDGNPGSQASAFTSSVIPTPDKNPSSFDLTGSGAWYKPYSDNFEDLLYKSPEYSVVATLQTTQLLSFQPTFFPNTVTTSYNNLINGAQVNLYADGRPYLLCNSNNTPFTQTWTYTLKAGTYSPQGLANLLTVAMAEVKKDDAYALNNNKAVQWFDPNPLNPNYASNPPPPQVLDQPFLVQTNGSPPVYAVTSRQTNPATNNSGELAFYGNPQPYVQIHANQGIPDWTNIPAPNYSLCFKNIISDCPVDTVQMFPEIVGANVIPANQMIPGLTYQIVTLGLTNWYRCGDYHFTPPPLPLPAIGDVFQCIVPDNRNGSPIPVQNAIVGDLYQVANFGVPMNKIVQQDITAFQCIIGHTYTIVSLGDTNWNSMGYVGTPTVGGTFVCTGLETIPSPGSFKPINYQLMTVGQEYQLISLGLPYAPVGTSTYDTDWKILFNIPTIPVVNNLYVCAENHNIPLTNNLLTNILTGITFTITATSNLINWGALGYTEDPNINPPYPPVPVYDPPLLLDYTYQIVSLGVYFGQYNGLPVYDTNWGNLTNGTFPIPPGYVGAKVGDRFLTFDVLDVQTNLFNGELLNIIPAGTTILVVEPGTFDWSTIGQVFPPNPDGSFLVGVLVIPIVDPTVSGFLARTFPTGTVILIESYADLLPFTFTATANGVDNANEVYTYTGYVDGTGIVDFIFVDGTCIDNAALNLIYDTNWVHIGNTQIIPTNNNPFSCTATYQPWAIQNYFFLFVVGVSYTITKDDGTINWQLFCSTLPTSGYVYPLTFVCNQIPATLPIARFIGIINATGQLATTLGTVRENIGQNFFLYPLTIGASPYINNIQQGNSAVGGPMYNYQFPMVGSTEISIQYNADTNRFEWLYIDTPILQQDQPTPASTTVNTTPYIERVGIINTFSSNIQDIQVYSSSYNYRSSTCKLVSKSGCMFRKMQPESFWQGIMGFSPDLIVTDKELGLSPPSAPALDPITPLTLDRFTYKRFNDVTTRGLLTTAMNFTNLGLGVGALPNLPHINAEPSYIAGYPVNLLNNSVLTKWYQYEMAMSLLYTLNLGVPAGAPGGPNITNGFSPDPFYPLNTTYKNPPIFNSQWYDALDQRSIISGVSAPLLVSDETGHYLLEIEGYSGGGLLNEQQKYNVKSIVSSYYVNPGTFTSGVFPDPQVYIHVGEPLVLQNFTVRILNPVTMQPIGGLGANSCVYLQINKNYSDVEQKQNDSS